MEKYILQKQDYEDISFLINVSKALGEIYKELYEIENKLGKNSKEYQECLKRLNSFIDIENNIYNGIKNSFNKCLVIIEYLEESMKNKIDVDKYSIIFDNVYSNELLRIIIRLKKFMFESEEKIVSLIEFPDENVKQPIVKAFAYSSRIFSVAKIDTLKCFLAILKKDNLNEFYTEMKYKISYLCPEIEEEFLNNGFEVDNNPYISAQLFTDFLSTDKTLLENVRLTEFSDNLNEQIDEFVKYVNSDLENSKIKNNLILRTYFLRSLIIFIDCDIIEKIKENFQKEIISKCDNSYLVHMKRSLNILGDCFNHQKEDIEVPKLLTLKKL